MYKYPYGDSQQLNLDWILAKIKELEAESPGNVDLEEVSNALISLTYNPDTIYARYDYAFRNGKLYRCLSGTSGAFDPAAWQEALIGDDLAVLTRWINAIDAAAVVDVKFDASGTNGKIQQKYHEQYHDVVEVDYTPVQNSKRPLSSNAGYELSGAINDTQGSLATIETGSTASKSYKVGEYFVYNGKLCRVTATIAQGGSFTASNNTLAYVGSEMFVTSITYNAWSPLFVFRTDANSIYVIIPCGNLAHKSTYTVTGTISFQLYPIGQTTAINTGTLTLNEAVDFNGTIFLSCVKPSNVSANLRGICTLTSALTFST